MKRRDFLKRFGLTTATLGAYTSVSSAVLNQFFISNAYGAEVSLHPLAMLLSAEEAMVLVPSSADFSKFNKAFNLRTNVTPSVRVLCLTEQAISKCIQWAQEQNVPLAMRNGGHSYEGLSSTTGLVIDVRLREKMNLITDGEDSFLQVESGAKLGNIYEFLAPYGLTIPAGSCPTVGVTGHTTGGGFGLLARTFGLACDSLLKARIVVANGEVLNVSDRENADLFWAIRGAGGGSYGVITEMTFKTSKVKEVVVFGVTFVGDQNVILTLMKQWLAWAPKSLKEINCLMRLQKVSDSSWSIRIYGQRVPLSNEDTAQTEKRVNDMLDKFIKIKSPEPGKMVIKPLSFIDSVHRFAGSATELPSVYMKGKSDYIRSGITDEGLKIMISQIPMGIASMFDCYGGAIANHQDSDMAFAHREDVLCSIQHYSEWQADTKNPVQLEKRSAAYLSNMKKYYASLRPYVSGHSYVNYCDIDIEDYASAYWGNNLARLVDIKNKYDPTNSFRHAQSIPLKITSPKTQAVPDQTAKSQIFELNLVSGEGTEIRKPVRSQLQIMQHAGQTLLYAKFEVSVAKIFAPPTLSAGQYPFQFEAVEIFLRANQDSQDNFSYYEIELSPYNQTFLVQIDCENSKKKMLNDVDLQLKSQVTRSNQGWIGEIWLPLDKIKWSGKIEDISGNIFAILGQKPNRNYFSAFTPPQQKPNFHLPELFQKLF